MLHGRCRYLLVDDFDKNIAEGFLRMYGFNDEKIELVWNHFGGKPVYPVEAIKVKARGDDLRKFCDEMLQIRKNQIRLLLNNVKRGKFDIELKDVVDVLRLFEKKEVIEDFEMTNAVEFLIENNVLFFDPVKGILRPQSRLDPLAFRLVIRVLR